MSDVPEWLKGLRNMAIFLDRTISTSICSGKLTSRYSRISVYPPQAAGYASVMR
jgi:hypothetical protein